MNNQAAGQRWNKALSLFSQSENPFQILKIPGRILFIIFHIMLLLKIV